MLGKCKECNSEVGYFKLHDGVCNSCIEKNNSHVGKIKRLSRNMPVLTWLLPIFIVFQLASPWIFQGIVSGSPEVAAVTNPPEIQLQLLFSIILLVTLLVPLLISFIIRFFVARRRLHIVLTWIILFVLFSMPIVVLSMGKGGNSTSFITIIFSIIVFKILRLENLPINTEAKSNA